MKKLGDSYSREKSAEMFYARGILFIALCWRLGTGNSSFGQSIPCCQYTFDAVSGIHTWVDV